MSKLYFVLFYFYATIAHASDISMSIGGGNHPPISSPVGGPSPFGPNPLGSGPNPGNPDGVFYGKCGGRGFTCNFLKSGAHGIYQSEAQTRIDKSRQAYQHQLDSETAKVDRDIEAVRQGVPGESPEGQAIKTKVDKLGNLKKSFDSIKDHGLLFIKEAEHRTSGVAESRIRLAYSESSENDYRPTQNALETNIAQGSLTRKISAGLRRADYVDRELRGQAGPYQSERLTFAGVGRDFLETAQVRVEAKDIEGAQTAYGLGMSALDLALSFTPIISTGKDAYEFLSGKNLLTGELLSDFDRTMAAIGFITLGIGSKVGKGVKAIEKGVDILGNIGKNLDNAEDVTKAVDSARDLLSAASKAGAETADGALQVLGSAKKLGIDAKDISAVTNEVNHFAAGKAADIYEAAAKNAPLGLGSTGRSIPKDLKEQAAMLVTRADPQLGDLLKIKLNDPRWPAVDGWEKRQTIFEDSEGRNLTIHYVRNNITGMVDDFKFKE